MSSEGFLLEKSLDERSWLQTLRRMMPINSVCSHRKPSRVPQIPFQLWTGRYTGLLSLNEHCYGLRVLSIRLTGSVRVVAELANAPWDDGVPCIRID